MKDKIISIMRKFIVKYDVKRDTSKPNYICDRFDTRNRYKNDEYKIPEDKPQCPIYKDNRCCGDCKYTETCEHMVDCNCFGIVRSIMGGTSESKMMRKASDYYKYGRMKDNDEFDWDYYKARRFEEGTKEKPYFIVKLDGGYFIAKLKGKLRKDGRFRVHFIDKNYYKMINMSDKESQFYGLYETYEKCKINNSYFLNKEEE